MRPFNGRKPKAHLAFVLGGGGARGALQVGALRALLEAGFRPDLLVGTSIGAVNATGLALWGVDLAGIEALEHTWQDAADVCLLDPRLARVFLRRILGRPGTYANRQISQFFAAQGVTPDLRFEHITGVRLALIGADLASGQTVIYGQNPHQSVLEGVLASIALPPWFVPVEKEGRHIVDGGFLSNLPIEPALTLGATEIIALDLNEGNTLSGYWGDAIIQYVEKLSYALNQRHTELEIALAEARGAQVHYIALKSPVTTPLWDFANYQELITVGYETAREHMQMWECTRRAAHLSWN